MNEYDENTRALIQAHVIPGPLPEPYGRVIEELSAEEVEALISIKNRLEEATRGQGGEGSHMGMVVPL
jgi:hypothetical protein